MKKKGFTLIELLAVVIVLGIIALIAIPTVTKVVNNSKDKAINTSMSGYADAAMTSVYEYLATNNKYPNTIDSSTIYNQGDKVYCENVLYSEDYGVVLYSCSIKEENSEPKYCFAQHKTYKDCNDEEFQNIYNSSIVVEKSLIEELLKQHSETNTVGLLKDTNNSYYYKGTNTEVANNFVWFGGHLWRVLTINDDNTLTMITQQPLTAIQPASSVWTTQAEYEASYINHWLNDMTDGVFLKSMEEIDRNKILNSTFNVGIYTNVSEITTTQKVGLLDETQYIKAGGNNSFLDIENEWWLGNYDNALYMHSVDYSGSIYYCDLTFANGVRPVIKISDLIFVDGKGTLDNPYRENSTTTNTSNIKVGEYVSIPTTGNDCGTDKRCLFRVVSKDNNSIKVILNGLLPSTSETTVTYTSGSAIDNIVTTFANTINQTNRYNESDKVFNIGVYDAGASYTVAQTSTYTGNVGLPVVGEMFSGNDINVLTSAKNFVNVNTIENPTVSDYFWTMNASDTASVHYVYNMGNLFNYNPATAYGVRPVLFLNNNLTFTSGEGTAENPYMLGN